MVPELAAPVRRVTFALLALAAVATEVAADDRRAVVTSAGLAAVWVAAAGLLARLLPSPADPRSAPPGWVVLVLAALAATPFAAEPLRREWTGEGYPLELQLVCGLRTVGLGLAAFSGWAVCLRLAGVTSLFLVLFAAAMTNHPAVRVVLGLYTATGSVWLVLVYWAGLRSVFVAPEKVVAVEVVGGGRVPWPGVAVLILLLAGAAAVAAVGPRRAAAALGELVPTSGGTGETDPFARSGVGDGPEEVAGDDAKAAGMVETDKMIEDNHNALVDAVSDMYGPPHKPRPQPERMVAAGLVDVIRAHGDTPENRRPSREFDTSRKGPRGDRTPDSRAARGVFEVEGRTPLHVRLVAYDRYDPAGKRWAEAGPPVGRPVEPDGDGWMRPGRVRDADWYPAGERHRLKTADMTSNLVPTPALTTRWRIHRVDRPEYYGFDADGVLVLPGRKRTPPGVVVTTDCRAADPARLPEPAFPRVGPAGGTPTDLGDVPDPLRPRVEQLARAWAGDLPRGWPQVEAVLARLRTGYVLDGTTVPPADHPDPVAWFLTESHRGPDYLFATAAALLLRTLDYPARVSLGYYAAPDHYDPETAHTPVRATDLHVWPEVLLRDGQWLVVEPTPGFEVLGPAPSLSDRVLGRLAAVVAWGRRHAVELALGVAVLAAVWVRRRALVDALAVRVWTWSPGRTWRDQVRKAVSVLERRGRWAAKPRQARQTASTWLRAAAPAPDAADLVRLTRLAEWAAYAPCAAPPCPEPEVLAVCRRVVGGWTLSRWQDPTPAPGARP